MVEVRLLPGIADPQGATLERALPALGFQDVAGVRVGKAVRFSISASDEEAARDRVEELCSLLLANPVMEEVTITLETAGQADRPGGTA